MDDPVDDPEFSEHVDSSPSQLPSKLPSQPSKPPRKLPTRAPSAHKNKGKACEDLLVAPMAPPASIPMTSKQKRRRDPSPDLPAVEEPPSETEPAPRPAAKATLSSKVPAPIPVVEISLTSPKRQGAESPPRKIQNYIPSAVGQVLDSQYMSYGTAALIVLAGALQSLHQQRLQSLLRARQATTNNGLRELCQFEEAVQEASVLGNEYHRSQYVVHSLNLCA